jgi:hypothetical protein
LLWACGKSGKFAGFENVPAWAQFLGLRVAINQTVGVTHDHDSRQDARIAKLCAECSKYW